MEINEEKFVSSKASEIWSAQESTPEYDSDSNPFEDDRSITKIKPEVELKEETEGFVYKADIKGHLKLVCSSSDITNSSNETNGRNECLSTSQCNQDKGIVFKGGFSSDGQTSDTGQPKNSIEITAETLADDPRCTSDFSPFNPHIGFSSDQKYVEPFQAPQNDYAVSQKMFSLDENFQNRCSELPDDGENKIGYHIELNTPFSVGKQAISHIRDNNDSSWIYNMQTMRLSEDIVNISDFSYLKDGYVDINRRTKGNSSDNEADLWQLYQELLMQKKMEGKFALTEEQKKEKVKEIGRIRARLYRAKLKQNDVVWKKHKALRAQKQREERLKMNDEQREKIKALARIRAKKHREKLKENEEAWKKYKDMRAEKQRLERIKAKEQVKEDEQQKEIMRLAEQSEKAKELARERAKKHRERLKEDSTTWHLYKETRAQRKREERLSMPNDQRERLKELARIRAKKYREKLKENAVEWKKYKELRARKQREERLKLTTEDKNKAKALARSRAKLYREKKKNIQLMSESKTPESSTEGQNWYDTCSNDNCSVYFYHSFLQNVPKDAIGK